MYVYIYIYVRSAYVSICIHTYACGKTISCVEAYVILQNERGTGKCARGGKSHGAMSFTRAPSSPLSTSSLGKVGIREQAGTPHSTLLPEIDKRVRVESGATRSAFSLSIPNCLLPQAGSARGSVGHALSGHLTFIMRGLRLFGPDIRR